MSFAERLRELIDEHDLTQKRLANELSIPASTLGGYVQGTSEPDFATLRLISAYFQVTTDYLLEVRVAQSENEQEAYLLRLFRALTPEEQRLYLEQGRAFLRVKTPGRK